MSDLELFAVCAPGLEAALASEAQAQGFDVTDTTPGGVTLRGGWPEVWRANLSLRGAVRVLVRIGAFPVAHLAQLDKRARKFPWSDTLRPDVPIRVETTCRKSRIYHQGAATERIETALRESLGATIDPQASLVLKVRIERDMCTFSLDTSGEPLHRRGHKEAVGKAPMRETLAAAFLRDCGFDGTGPVLDPMCGSGTFPIEAAEIAAGLLPGRSRAFAFETLASFDAAAFARMRGAGPAEAPGPVRFYGSDRDQGAVQSATANAARAGVGAACLFERRAVGDIVPPEGPPGLVVANPPYGGRIGNKKLLFALHGAFGEVLKARFRGWRVGIVTSEPGLARATGLPFLPPGPPVPHGGLKVRLYRTKPLP
ncbi:THUMP domain-containing class I SAM-dependent RNA methyltransferase [Roseivivax isoporae]|uniref:RNA methyltransferase n=1 Tax=Roseivivax isoporae LMG 25204 TaxID=1449351 RepID=X7F765_9RHOB|nr:RNA methyltransferase [Roseivivax isoporae]ETX27924.1 RNA methyltransferase [Roseivivax isoporae LMG 25204]